MPQWTCHRKAAAPHRAVGARWPSALPRALFIVAILLMPVQMRAGVSDPHPHALIQVLLDASDGQIDHHAHDGHAADAHERHAEETAESGAHDPDTPSFEKPSPAASGTPMMAALVALLVFPAPGARHDWPKPTSRRGRIPTIDPPPPRLSPS